MNFIRSERGYVLVISLLFLPIFLLIALIIIDIGRGNNAHSDLQAAADATALAGAVKLDGGYDAIDRAEDAMRAIWNTVGLLEAGGENVLIDLDFETDFTVFYLTAIPTSDDDPIDQAWVDSHGTTSGYNARYVYVRAQSVNLNSIFAGVRAGLTGEVPVAAVAVATAHTMACDVPPLFICNPFEEDLGPGPGPLQSAFEQGKLHGRLIKLHPPGSTTAAPGNFGFLSVDGTSSANAIREFFAGHYVPACYEASDVDTAPGAAVSIRTGINIRFDMYDAPFKNAADLYTPAYNVRKGYTGSECSQELLDPPVPEEVMGFLPNGALSSDGSMAPPGSGVPGAAIGSGDWPLVEYWKVNHGVDHTSNPGDLYALIGNSMPGALAPGAQMPSRYDVYRYEISQTIADPVNNNLVGDVSIGGETGAPVCSASQSGALAPSDPLLDVTAKDRRVLFAAVIDCLDNPFNGATTIPVNTFVSMFLTNPMEKQGTEDGTIDVEIIDITGNSGNGTLDAFLRPESFLVR